MRARYTDTQRRVILETLADFEAARIIGVSRQRAMQLRRRLGVGEPMWACCVGPDTYWCLSHGLVSPEDVDQHSWARAVTWARAQGLSWPWGLRDGCIQPTGNPRRAYEMRRDTGRPWREIGAAMGYRSDSTTASPQLAILRPLSAAKRFAQANDLPWPPR